jgi:hypothetical protein
VSPRRGLDPAPPPEALAPPPARRRAGAALLERRPIFAALALGACAFLLWDLWPDVSYALSSRSAIDLGAPGDYHLDRARANRLHRVAGLPAAAVGAVAGGSGEERTVVGLAGTSLLVDRPGRAAAAGVYEGRLLARSRSLDYAQFVGALRERGFDPGERWAVLRDGERPGGRLGRPALALVVLAVAAVNARALLRRLLPST